jgi:hypothetical protein
VPVEETTAGRGYPKPFPANTLSTDVERLRSALDAIDADIGVLNGQVTAAIVSNVTGITGASEVPNIVRISKANYDALNPVPADVGFIVEGTAADEPLTVGTGLVVVQHGSNANTPRPPSAAAVYWIGSIQPTNSIDADLWFPTAVV